MGLFPDRSVQRKAKDKQLMMCHPLGHPPVSSCAVLRMQAEKESRVKEAKREVSRIQMEAEARKQELVREAAAQKRAAEAARREEQAPPRPGAQPGAAAPVARERGPQAGAASPL